MHGSRARGAAIGLAALSGPVAAIAFPDPAFAHALVGRKDLPIPAWLFAWGASIVLIVSFAVLSVAWHKPRLQEERWRPVRGWVSRLTVNDVLEALAGALGVGLLALVVYSGLHGTEDPLHNFSVTFVFYTFWLGIVLLSVLLGNVFRALNPWRAVARVFSAGFRLVAGQPAPAPLRYPEWLGRWPAVAGLLAFAFIELVYGGGIAPSPHDVAVAAVIYTAITFVAMALFGIEAWLAQGEAFSVYFGMLSRLAVLEVRAGRLGRSRFLSGPPAWEVGAASVAVVLTSIGVTSFDGAQEGLWSGGIQWTFDRLQDAGLGTVADFRLANSIWLAITLAMVASLYWLGIAGMHTVRGSPPRRELGRSFAHTMIPIALAYLVAHYFSAVVFQEQAQFTYLLSDPLGTGANIFGTACSSCGINYGVISANAVWYVQVGALIAGHVAGLTLAHDRAIATYDDYLRASRSQYFMLAVMVCFTSLGLFLLSQANG
jgi:hypothetical protein